MKQKIIPILSLLAGILAFLLTLQYLNTKQREFEALKQKLYAGARQIWVVAPSEDIPHGMKLRADDLGKISILEREAHDRVVLAEDAALLLGKTSLLPLSKNKPILWSDIEGGAVAAGGLSSMVQHGRRAMSLPISGASGVSGMIEPGDRVDVVGTFSMPAQNNATEMETVTLTVLQDVSVLATGQTTSRQPAGRRSAASGSTAYSSVTLEVTPREAELLVFAQQAKGRLSLTLRNPADVSFEKDLPEINFREMEKRLPELNQYRQKNIRGKRD